ncbi:hypothetical protein WR25_24178 [Diploscapter pachys]|uniref:Uncharacterized protein n=1 Tax=Diploscapter pachys TaxID=2018661 RepID=A0A2A2KZC1_9BILA|nr:hypothetical protein WR25_24178 [Diploscapter pachys]
MKGISYLIDRFVEIGREGGKQVEVKGEAGNLLADGQAKRKGGGGREESCSSEATLPHLPSGIASGKLPWVLSSLRQTTAARPHRSPSPSPFSSYLSTSSSSSSSSSSFHSTLYLSAFHTHSRPFTIRFHCFMHTSLTMN